jgi:hypothetical protein
VVNAFLDLTIHCMSAISGSGLTIDDEDQISRRVLPIRRDVPAIVARCFAFIN